MNRLLLMALLPLTLSGCGNPAIDQATEAVKATLKDPSSVQFRNLKQVGSLPARNKWGALYPGLAAGVCGEFNAKNSMGGYVGFRPFAWEEASGKLILARDDGAFLWQDGHFMPPDAEPDYSRNVQALPFSHYCDR